MPSMEALTPDDRRALEALGTSKAVKQRERDFARLERDKAYIASEFDKLIAEYNGEWIAVSECEVIGHSIVLQSLVEQLRHEGVDTGRVVLEFMTDEPMSMLL